MPLASEMKFSAEKEQQFRRGYTHGVQAVITAVEPHLNAKQNSKLRVWASNVLGDWAHNIEGFKEAPNPPEL